MVADPIIDHYIDPIILQTMVADPIILRSLVRINMAIK